MRKYIFLVLFCLIFSLSAFSFQFDEYQWGTTYSQMRSKIKASGKTLMAIDNDRILKYADRILDEDCVVTFEFSPISKELALIKITWADKGIAEDMKKILVEKYGEYTKNNLFIEEYRWQSGGEFDVIILEYDYAGTTLTYYGGDSYRKYQEEFDKFYENEKDIF